MSSRAAVVFVPTSFATPGFYERVVAKLKEHGVEATTAALQSVGKKEPTPTVADDAAAIQAVVKRFIDEDKDVLLVAHSYGGVPSTESIKGMSKAARERDGYKNGIVGIVYASAVVPCIGENTIDFVNLPRDNPMMIMDDEHWAHVDLKLAAYGNFNGVPEEEGIKLARHFGQHCMDTFATPLVYPGYKDVPVSWIMAEQDLFVPVALQQRAIETIEKESGNKVSVYKLNCGHGIFLPDPNPAAEVILEVLGN